MAVSFDPVISNIFFTLGLIPHILKKEHGYYTPALSGKQDTFVTVLVPLYREPFLFINNLSSRLMAQTYDHNKIEIIFITEPDDKETNRYVEKIAGYIKNEFASVRVLVSDGREKMKPYALNQARYECIGDIIGIYDAECKPEKQQIEKAVCSFHEKDFDVVQTRIEVESDNILGEFCKLDIFLWTEKILPFINAKSGSFPLGTKGLFIKKECLDEIGWFPLHLTEDAMMAILLASQNKKFGLLDSITSEVSTKSWGTHFKQRRRWFRGYLSCIIPLVRSKMPVKRKLWLSIPYISPLLCTASLLGFIFMLLFFTTWVFYPNVSYVAPWMDNVLYDCGFFYWSLFLGYVGLPISLFSYLNQIADSRFEDRVLYVLLTPVYWVFVGVVALSSFLKDTKSWDKTMREL